ncbi:MAG: YiiD C-terminal domain-containing protein [Opitutae bacterium]|nr:YiiD C-terminal domain-containing protein [Opitutae bacterium]
MAESWKIKLLRWRFNWYPAFRNTGARVVYISEDMMEAKLRLPLCRTTRNVHGTIYGGSMYAAVDPLHAVMVAIQLGPDYHVWMKSAKIEFRRPGRGDLHAHARLHQQDLDAIRAALASEQKVDRDFAVALADPDGEIAAHFTLTLHIRRRLPHEPPMHGAVFP